MIFVSIIFAIALVGCGRQTGPSDENSGGTLPPSASSPVATGPGRICAILGCRAVEVPKPRQVQAGLGLETLQAGTTPDSLEHRLLRIASTKLTSSTPYVEILLRAMRAAPRPFDEIKVRNEFALIKSQVSLSDGNRQYIHDVFSPIFREMLRMDDAQLGRFYNILYEAQSERDFKIFLADLFETAAEQLKPETMRITNEAESASGEKFRMLIEDRIFTEKNRFADFERALFRAAGNKAADPNTKVFHRIHYLEVMDWFAMRHRKLGTLQQYADRFLEAADRRSSWFKTSMREVRELVNNILADPGLSEIQRARFNEFLLGAISHWYVGEAEMLVDLLIEAKTTSKLY